MSSYKLEIEGLKELQAKYSEEKLSTELVSAVGVVTKELHDILNSNIKEKYGTNRSLTSFSTVPIGKRSVKFIGSKILEGTLEYRHEALNLGLYPSHSSYMGNLEPRADKPREVWGRKRQGLVQRVLIVRKNGQKVIYGKTGYGGFRAGGSRYIVERTGPERRAPTKPVWGPTVAKMAEVIFNENPAVRHYVNSIGDRILKELKWL